jgi:hypothetical protein
MMLIPSRSESTRSATAEGPGPYQGGRAVFDGEYDGVRNYYFPDLKCAIPFKRRGRGRGHRGEKAPDITPEQKSFNNKLSSERVVVEHTNRERMPRWRRGADRTCSRA